MPTGWPTAVDAGRTVGAFIAQTYLSCSVASRTSLDDCGLPFRRDVACRARFSLDRYSGAESRACPHRTVTTGRYSPERGNTFDQRVTLVTLGSG